TRSNSTIYLSHHNKLTVNYIIIRQPLTSTLFPYTTLFRSYRQQIVEPYFHDNRPNEFFSLDRVLDHFDMIFSTTIRPVARRRRRSEEHTSELQSLRHLVCRLLLEKKKTAYHLEIDNIVCQQ